MGAAIGVMKKKMLYRVHEKEAAAAAAAAAAQTPEALAAAAAKREAELVVLRAKVAERASANHQPVVERRVHLAISTPQGYFDSQQYHQCLN